MLVKIWSIWPFKSQIGHLKCDGGSIISSIEPNSIFDLPKFWTLINNSFLLVKFDERGRWGENEERDNNEGKELGDRNNGREEREREIDERAVSTGEREWDALFANSLTSPLKERRLARKTRWPFVVFINFVWMSTLAFFTADMLCFQISLNNRQPGMRMSLALQDS